MMRSLRRFLPVGLGVGLLACLTFAKAPPAHAELPGCGWCDPGYTCQTVYDYSYYPGGASNAYQGDLIFHTSSAVTKSIVNSLGQQHSHVGIFSDNYHTVRHNTGGGYADKNNQHKDYAALIFSATFGQLANFLSWALGLGENYSYSMAYGSAQLDGWVLYGKHQRFPGTGTHEANVWDERDPDEPWNPYWNRGTVKLLKPLDDWGINRAAAQKIAVKTRDINRFYGLYGFRKNDPAGQYSDGKGAMSDGGSMCSGMIYEAAKAVAPTDANVRAFTQYPIPNDKARAAAWAGWWTVRNQARQEVAQTPISCGCWALWGGYQGGCPDPPPGALGGCHHSCGWGYVKSCVLGKDVLPSASMDGVADGLADQVTNCFLYGDEGTGRCGKFSSAWKSDGNLGGHSVSPDHLIGQGRLHELAAYAPLGAKAQTNYKTIDVVDVWNPIYEEVCEPDGYYDPYYDTYYQTCEWVVVGYSYGGKAPVWTANMVSPALYSGYWQQTSAHNECVWSEFGGI